MNKPRSLDLDGLDGIVQPSRSASSGTRWLTVLGVALIILGLLAIAWLIRQDRMPRLTLPPAVPQQAPETTETTVVVPQENAPVEPIVDSSRDKQQPAEAMREAEQASAETALPTEATAAGPQAGAAAYARFTVQFQFDSSKPMPLSETETGELVKLAEHCQNGIRITGHTCNVGSEEVNRRLGLARAEAVKEILLANGVSGQQIETVSEGEDRPIAANDTADGRARNRRAELTCPDR